METPQQKKARGTDEYSGHLKHEVRGRGREGGVGGRGRELGSGEDGGVFLELVSQYMLVPVPLLHSSLLWSSDGSPCFSVRLPPLHHREQR